MSSTLSRRTLIQSTGALSLSTVMPIAATNAAAQSTPEVLPASRAVVTMSPQHGSMFALPGTTIAFRGVTADQIGNIYVSGSLSGPASGALREHSDGNGVTWKHDAEFLETETVIVRADVPLTDASDGAATFVIGEQAPRPATSPIEDRTTASDDDSIVHSFRSRPDMAPVKIDVDVLDASRIAPGVMAVTPNVPGGQSGAHLVDNAGETIWHHTPADINHVIYCLNMQVYNGEPVLTWWEGGDYRGWGYGHYVIADQSYNRIATIQAGHGLNGLDLHDLVLTDYGTAWAASYHSQWAEVGGIRRNVIEYVIQEIDVASGDIWWEWHSLDHVGLEESNAKLPEDPGFSWDHFHGNSIEVDNDGELIVSSRTSHTIFKISVKDHQIIWRLGGELSDFRLDENAKFYWQHDARRASGGTLSLFDNHDDTNEDESRGIVFELDEVAMTATLLREYHRDGGMWSPYQSNMQTLENTNLFIGWGSGPRCSEFTHEGEMIFDMKYRAGGSYRGYRIAWNATPDRPLDYVLDDAPDGYLTCYVSWNGATEVSGWQVIAGPTVDAAEVVAIASKTTFETELAGVPISAYMEAQALNATGQIIGGRILQRGG